MGSKENQQKVADCMDQIKRMDIGKLCQVCSDEMDFNEDKLSGEMSEIVQLIVDDYNKGRDIDAAKPFEQPDQDEIVDIISKLLMILYPGYYRDRSFRTRTFENKQAVLVEDVMYHLRKQIELALLYDEEYTNVRKVVRKRAAQMIVIEFFRTIPKIREYLDTDIQALYDGDPAATNKEEIILCYPGLYAITIHRIAHELVKLNVPVIPRMMSEHAHRETGVDIHPAATIGKYFMIDHATGIVVGATTEIGDHVKLYQGVTLGALSTKQGQALHGVKRHPTIEDNVTLYSGASVLGGNTVIGEGAVIGGNSFVTHSIPPYTTVNVKLDVTTTSQDEKK